MCVVDGVLAREMAVGRTALRDARMHDQDLHKLAETCSINLQRYQVEPAARRCSMTRTRPAPPIYNPTSGAASRSWVNGSVEGVSTAAATTAPTTTNRHWLSMSSDVTMPSWPSSTWITGTCWEHVRGGPHPPWVTHLEGQAGGQHQHQHKLKVLIDRPQRLDCAVGVRHEKLERCRGQDLIRKEQPESVR